MDKRRSDQPRVAIQFPSLLSIPLLSLIIATFKWCGACEFGWVTGTVIVPICLYSMWTVALAIAWCFCYSATSRRNERQ